MKIKNGFSLVEVNLAIFVVSIGLLTLFALFPAGLKEGEAGHADTQTSLFADYVLATVRANAANVTAATWGKNPFNVFLDELPNAIDVGGNHPNSIEFPIDSGLHVRYYLNIYRDGDLYGVSLWLAAGEYGTTDLDDFKESSELYYTELFFSGMP